VAAVAVAAGMVVAMAALAWVATAAALADFRPSACVIVQRRMGAMRC